MADIDKALKDLHAELVTQVTTGEATLLTKQTEDQASGLALNIAIVDLSAIKKKKKELEKIYPELLEE